MFSDALTAALQEAIAGATGERFVIQQATPASGGCIHSSWVLAAGEVRYFAKLNDARFAASFAAEAEGLAALREGGMRAPRPLAHGTQFGWHRDNFIGSTPQSNAMGPSWAEFWRHQRLAPQLALAAQNGHRGRVQWLGEQVIEAVPWLLAGHEAVPALLHGDLWRGNAAVLESGAPVVFDPAVYYGDPEADLAMTELFGGFPESFYEGYREMHPVAGGYKLRRVLYNLYHVLNHLNLFGESYRSQAEQMMQQLVRATS